MGECRTWWGSWEGGQKREPRIPPSLPPNQKIAPTQWPEGPRELQNSSRRKRQEQQQVPPPKPPSMGLSKK